MRMEIEQALPQEGKTRASAERPIRLFRIPKPIIVFSQFSLGLMIGFAILRGAAAFWRNSDNPWFHIWNSLPSIAFICGVGNLLLVIVSIIERKGGIPHEYHRKIAHIGAGVISLALPALFSSHWPVFVVTVLFSATLLLSRNSKWLACLHPDGRGKSDVLFLWAVYLVFLIADGNRLLFQTSVLMLTVGDAAAALAGQKYGRSFYKVSESIRSIEGSLAFAASGLLCLLLFFFSQMGLVPGQLVALSVLLATVASVVEALTPNSFDNMTVPIATLFLSQAIL